MGNPYEVAEAVIELGYRKLTEDIVIVSKERFEALETIEKYHIKSCGKDSVVLSKEEICELKCQAEEDFNKAYDLGSKETAEKIIDLIKTFFPDKKFIETISHIINERFAVEIKE